MPSKKIETRHQETVHDVSMDYSGKRIATASSDTTAIGYIQVGWDKERIEQAHPPGVTSVSWAPPSPPGSLPGPGSEACLSTTKVWKLDNGAWIHSSPALHMHTDSVKSVAWAPNLGLPRSTIASPWQHEKVVVWTNSKEVQECCGLSPETCWTLADGSNSVTQWKESAGGKSRALAYKVLFVPVYSLFLPTY